MIKHILKNILRPPHGRTGNVATTRVDRVICLHLVWRVKSAMSTFLHYMSRVHLSAQLVIITTRVHIVKYPHFWVILGIGVEATNCIDFIIIISISLGNMCHVHPFRLYDRVQTSDTLVLWPQLKFILYQVYPSGSLVLRPQSRPLCIVATIGVHILSCLPLCL